MTQLRLKISSCVFASLLALGLLSGCSQGTFNACPPIVVYSNEQQLLVADELVQLEPGSELLNMMTDYAKLRQQLRYCLDE
jgi:hypothetical protein